MKAVLLRTGSVAVHSPAHPGSQKISLSRHDSVSGIFSREKNTVCSPRISLHLEVSRRRDTPIRRALSVSDVIRSEREFPVGLRELSGAGSRSFPTSIPEDEEEHLIGVDNGGIWPDSGIPVKELGFSGDGFGKGKKYGGGGNGGDSGMDGGDISKMDEHYRQMLTSNPGDSLLLRNYAKYLQEVEGDMERAEEYYGRAILASPGDGEVLSLYGKLIWEAQRDGERAKSYFDQAVCASPNDCMVLGSYAHFMWEAEEEEEDDVDKENNVKGGALAVPVVTAF